MLLPLLLAAGIAAGAQQSAPRDAAARPAAGGIIRGRVTSAATRQPLHRVRITLNASTPNPPTAVTDTQGLFELAGVPPGSYSLTAARAGYLTIQYGQRRPRERGLTFEIKNGDVLPNVNVALYKGGVLSGRIVDESGEPAAGVRVEAVEQRYIRGRRVAVAAKIVTTNDAGEYRLSGLEPGPYTIRASSTEVWDSEDGKSTYAYATTYFPGVTGADRPDTLTVALGQEVSGIDVRLVPGRTAQITGTVIGATGEPMAGVGVNLDVIGRTIGGALASAGFGGSAQTDASGAFAFRRLAPGEYTVYTGQSERVMVSVTVDQGETRQVVLAPRRPTGVAGTIRFDESGPPSFAPGRLRIDPIAADRDSVFAAWNAPRPASPQPDWSFRLPDLDGAYLLRVTGLPDQWRLLSITLGDRDLTDTPLTIQRGLPDVTGVQILLSRKGGSLSGDVVEAAGAAAPDATVIVFPEHSGQWGVASRFVKTARVDRAGHFAIPLLPPGVYRAIALDAVADGQWEDAAFLASLLKDAVRVEIKQDAPESLKLTIGGAR